MWKGICKFASSFESMTTVSASEPLLSDAVYAMMSKPSFDVPKTFKAVSEGFLSPQRDHSKFVRFCCSLLHVIRLSAGSGLCAFSRLLHNLNLNLLGRPIYCQEVLEPLRVSIILKLLKTLKQMLKTPFADRLCTNYVPLDHEIKQIHRLVAGPLKKISRLDEKISCLYEKIAHLQSKIDDLQREREVFSSFIDAHGALLSGIRRLPQELLQEIFTYCLPSDSSEVIRCKEAPILLGRICSLWRRIVMSTPHLWSSIYVDVPDRPLVLDDVHPGVLQRVMMVERLVELSGTCPLSISFTYNFVETPEAMISVACALFQALCLSSQRWETLELCLPPVLFVKLFATFSETNVPMLKRICFTAYNYLEGVDSVMPTLASAPIFRVPSLRSLSTSHLDITLLVAGWNHLNHQDFDGLDDRFTASITAPKAIQILSLCPNLVSCRMADVKALDAHLSGGISAISLPFLRSLDITGSIRQTSDFTAFFDALKMPSLRELKFTHYALGGAVVPFKSIISPRIESIELSLMTLSTAAECLPRLPFLKRLSVHNPYHFKKPLGDERLWDDDLLTLLTPSLDTEECLCPHLEEIVFRECFSITNDAIRIFLTARTSHPAVTPLKTATFTLSRGSARNLMAELEPLRERLSVNISCSYYSRGFVLLR